MRSLLLLLLSLSLRRRGCRGRRGNGRRLFNGVTLDLLVLVGISLGLLPFLGLRRGLVQLVPLGKKRRTDSCNC